MKLYIENNSVIMEPIVKEGIKLSYNRKGTPGTLNFEIVIDNRLNIDYGNVVILQDDNDNLFKGYIFTKQESEDGHIKITAYDQLQYLIKNKDKYVFSNMTASEIIKKIASDYKLNLGDIEDTNYVIASRVEDNKTLLDMIYDVLEITLLHTKKLYVLYDDFGKLTLKNIANTEINLLIDNEAASKFNYNGSIDQETYNKIKLYQKNENGKNEIYIVEDTNNQKKWGILQLYEQVDKNENGQNKADAMITLYNKPTESISYKDCFGDKRIRAGSRIYIKHKFNSNSIDSKMIVDKVVHTFNNEEHKMDIELRGGNYYA